MANNYRQFSQKIDNLKPYERMWLEEAVISTDRFDDYDDAYKWAKEKFGRDVEDADYWPQFDYIINNDFFVYSEESGSVENVEIVVSAFLKKFRPKEVFVMNWADTCSKPRIDEFGGGAVIISAYETEFVHTYTIADLKACEMKKRIEEMNR